MLAHAAFGEDVLDGSSVLGQDRGLRLASAPLRILRNEEGGGGGVEGVTILKPVRDQRILDISIFQNFYEGHLHRVNK